MTSTWNQIKVACMTAQRFTHYATAVYKVIKVKASFHDESKVKKNPKIHYLNNKEYDDFTNNKNYVLIKKIKITIFKKC